CPIAAYAEFREQERNCVVEGPANRIPKFYFSLTANCPHAASISFPLLLLTWVLIPRFRRKSANNSILSTSAFLKSAKAMGLYSIIFTLQGTCLQNAASSAASVSSSLNSLNTIYSYVTGF